MAFTRPNLRFEHDLGRALAGGRGETLLTHCRTADVMLPGAVRALYRAAFEAGVRHVLAAEYYCLCVPRMAFPDFANQPVDTVHWDGILMVHNYPKLLAESGPLHRALGVPARSAAGQRRRRGLRRRPDDPAGSWGAGLTAWVVGRNKAVVIRRTGKTNGEGRDIGIGPVLRRAGDALRDVLAVVERSGEGVALVADENRHLLGIVTDGDVRRAILADADFAQPVGRFVQHKMAKIGTKKPLTAPVDTEPSELERLMRVRLVRHLPLLDADGLLAGLALQSRLSVDRKLPVRAVVMAGGFGTRLRPLTDDTPKPMLEVGGKPIIEHIVGQLHDAGIHRLNVTTHFHAKKIRDHLGDGSRFGVALSYTQEEEPLGTAGRWPWFPRSTSRCW